MEKFLLVIIAVAILIAVAIPLSTNLSSDVQPTATFTEQFTGTNGALHTTTHSPVSAVNSFYNRSLGSNINSTIMVGANSTSSIPLNSTVDNFGTYSFNITIAFNRTAANTVNVTLDGVRVGNLSTSPTTITVNSTSLTGPLTVGFRSDGTATSSNVSSITVSHYYLTSSSAYTASSSGITPTYSGSYRTSYTYLSNTNNSTNVVLGILPVMIALLAVVILVTRTEL